MLQRLVMTFQQQVSTLVENSFDMDSNGLKPGLAELPDGVPNLDPQARVLKALKHISGACKPAESAIGRRVPERIQ